MLFNYMPSFIIIGLIIYIIFYRLNIKERVYKIEKVIEEVTNKNFNARILINKKDNLSILEYKINELIVIYQQEHIAMRKNNSLRKQFFSDISHDIRTPITSIIGHLDAIVNSIVTSPSDINDYIIKSNNRARQLKILLDDIFEYAKADANELQINKIVFEINEVIRDVFIQYIPILETENIRLIAKIPEDKLYVFADEFCIKRIIQNLIDNAIQHGKSGKLIGIYVKKINKKIYIDIWDKGAGINEEEKEKVFKRLFKKTNSKNNINHGLGLAISKTLIEKNEGNIELDSIPNEKTTFRIILPELRNN